MRDRLEHLKNGRVYQLGNLLLRERSDKASVQLFRYVFVGGFSAVADVGALYILTSKFHVFYLMSAGVAFIVGTILNYILSILWIFEATGNTKLEVALFTLVGLGGLGWNELIIWLGVRDAHLYYLYAKLVALALVMLWNFSLRRLLFIKLRNETSE